MASGAGLGVVMGAVLDPLGQRLADRSRAADERRREDRRAAAAGTVATTEPTDGAPLPGGPRSVPDLDVVAGPATTGARPADGTAGDAVPEGPTVDAVPGPPVRHLLPEGRSVPRTVGAALVTGALFALAASHLDVPGRTGAGWTVLPFWVFLAMAVTVSVTDLTHRLVPRQLVFGALALIIPMFVAISAYFHDWRSLGDAAIAGAGAFAVFFLIWFFVPRGMGFGDVRLAGVIGVTVGYLDLLHAYVAFLAGFVLGLLFGLILMVGSSAGRKTRIPFAPSLCLGAVVAIVWGDPLVHHLFHAGS